MDSLFNVKKQDPDRVEKISLHIISGIFIFFGIIQWFIDKIDVGEYRLLTSMFILMIVLPKYMDKKQK